MKKYFFRVTIYITCLSILVLFFFSSVLIGTSERIAKRVGKHEVRDVPLCEYLWDTIGRAGTQVGMSQKKMYVTHHIFYWDVWNFGTYY